MNVKNRSVVVGVGVAVVIGLILAWTLWLRGGVEPEQVVYGISPYQDTILPIVAEEMGWYEQEELDVELRVLPWGDVMTAVAGGAVDVAIQNFNSFQAAHHNIESGGVEVVFWHPLFVFKGAAIVVRSEDGFVPLSKAVGDGQSSDAALISVVRQLEGKTIIATQGTEMEQVVLLALERFQSSCSV